ncbi:unnamed protein product [Alopecurus aequalis]
MVDTAAATVAALTAPTITLVIDTKANRVLFAEAGKEAVDYLFCILATPVGTVARQLRDDGGAQAVGVAKMYDSADKMDAKYMRSPAVRNSLLNSHKHTLLTHPTIGLKHWPGSTVPAASTSAHGTTTTTTTPVYAPSSMPVLSTSVQGMTTTYARSMPTYGPQYAASTFVHGPTTMTTPVYAQWMPAASTFVQGPTTTTPTYAPSMPTSYMPQYAAAATAPASAVAGGCPSCGCAGGCSSPTAGGFVQGTATYTVMDDLTIAPRSNVLSVMALINKLKGDEKDLVEKSVQLGVQEGMDILKASLRSNTVLTEVFLSKNTTDIVPLSSNKRARTTSGEQNAVQEKNEKTIPNYFI